MTKPIFFSAPASAFGYYKGLAFGPYAGGQGSGQGKAMAGSGEFAEGSGPPCEIETGWTPTLTYLSILVVAEMVIFGCLIKMGRS